MTITFRQLEVFVAAAKDCNFRSAAERLNMSQPSVSGHVRRLERHLGESLFCRRSGAKPELSAAGVQFLEKARQILRGKPGVHSSGPDFPDPSRVQLTVMAGPLLFKTCIRPRLPAFCSKHPNIDLQFVPLHPSRGPVQLMNKGEIDLAVYTGDRDEDWRVHSETVATVGCSIYGSPELVKRARQSGSKLSDIPWVMPPKDFAPTRFMWRFLRQAGIEPRNIIAYSKFPDGALNMTVRGDAFAVLFDDQAAQCLADGRIERVGPLLPPIPRMLIIGPRAQRSACEPAVLLLRQAIKTPLSGLAP